jgi:DNA invertase Pin-like site-specific DNA recombinase
MKKVAIYLRVSTTDQTTDNQRRELEAVSERLGWRVVRFFEDTGISGAKGKNARPGLAALLKAVARREVDLVAAWSVDRLGRSLTDLLEVLGELHARGVDLYLHQQGLDTSTPSGKAMFQMLGVFAEFERSMIRERVLAGMSRAAVTGTRSGKPIGRPRLATETEAGIRVALQKGDVGMRKVAVQFGVATGTVQRVARQIAAGSGP